VVKRLISNLSLEKLKGVAKKIYSSGVKGKRRGKIGAGARRKPVTRRFQ